MGIFPLAYSYLIVYWLINPHVFYEIIDNLHGTCICWKYMCTLLVKVPFYLLHIFVTSQMIAKHSSAVRQVHFSKRKSVHTTKIQIIKTT